MIKGKNVLIHWVVWEQEKIWNKEYPPEMEYLYSVAEPHRSSTDGKMHWNYFPTPNKVEIQVYDPEIMVTFILKFEK